MSRFLDYWQVWLHAALMCFLALFLVFAAMIHPETGFKVFAGLAEVKDAAVNLGHAVSGAMESLKSVLRSL